MHHNSSPSPVPRLGRDPALACADSRRRWKLGWLCLLAASVAPLPLHAQATKIFVASTGNDANDGSRGAPKRNFQAAHDAVAVGGEVVALDTAGYGALSITKSVGITAPAGITGFITTSGATNGVTINAGASDVVSLRGLTINAVNTTGGPFGILLTNVGTLNVSECTVSGYLSGLVCSNTSAAATVTVSASAFRAQSANGVVISAFSAAAVNLVLADCEIAFNGAIGLNVSASSTSGVAQRVEVHRTAVVGNPTTGISIAGANNSATIQSCTISANGNGLRAVSNATVKVDDCTLTGNTTGLATATGGSLFSRVSNTVEGNDTNGAFTNTTTYVAK